MEALAAVAHASPNHFYRLVLALMDQTLGDYLARRRLEKAAQSDCELCIPVAPLPRTRRRARQPSKPRPKAIRP